MKEKFIRFTFGSTYYTFLSLKEEKGSSLIYDRISQSTWEENYSCILIIEKYVSLNKTR